MMTTILAILLIAVWCLGATFVTVITGWDMGKVSDLVKIIFWPVSIFICSK